jgi:Domain of unknown function (DUF4352)
MGAGVLLGLAVVVVAVFVGIAIGRSEQQEEIAKKQPAEEETEATSDTNQKQTAPSKTMPPQSVVVGLGETGDLSDRPVTVNDLQGGYVFPHNIPSHQAGNEFILANITITNTSAQPIDVNVLNFEAEDSYGVRRKAQAANQVPNAIPPVSSIAPNGELTGNLVFEAPRGAPVLKLVYRPFG